MTSRRRRTARPGTRRARGGEPRVVVRGRLHPLLLDPVTDRGELTVGELEQPGGEGEAAVEVRGLLGRDGALVADVVLELGPGVLQHRPDLHLDRLPEQDRLQRTVHPARVELEQQVPAGVAEAPLAGRLPPEVAVVEHLGLVGEEVGDRLHVAVHVGDHAQADLVGDVAQRVGVGEHPGLPASRLRGERGDRLGPAGDGEVVDAGVVEHGGEQPDALLGAPLQLVVHACVGPDGGTGVARPAGLATPRRGGDVRRQGGRDDVAGVQVPVDRGRLRTPVGEQGDVGADHRVHLVLDPAQVDLAGGRLDRGPQRPPGAPLAVHLQRRVGAGKPFDQAQQHDQLTAQLLQVAAGLVLVLEGPPQPEEHHHRRVRVDLDRTPGPPRARVHVQAQPPDQPRAAGAIAELRLAGVAGVRAGVEAGEVLVEQRLGRPVAGGVAHDQRRVEGDQARPVDVRRQVVHDLVVGAHRGHVHQPAAVVEDRDAGRPSFAPRQVDSHEVHARSLSPLRWPVPVRRQGTGRPRAAV